MQKLQSKIAAFLKERGWDSRAYPGNYVKSIAIEAAELLELFQWKSPSADEILANPKMLKAVQEELADVMIYCLDLASVLDLDAEKIVEEKLALNAKKYPAKLVKGNSANYYKLKEAARKKRRK
jgi:NTP pyrophosphatase (non-canonical NTP hydrolase)